jgi:hypothetical protein
MRQLFGFGAIFLVLAGSAYGWHQQRSQPPAPADERAFSFADARLSAAAGRIEQMGDYFGSYDNVPGDLIEGMQVYGQGGGYCVHLMREGAWYRWAGPGGSTARGRCV